MHQTLTREMKTFIVSGLFVIAGFALFSYVQSLTAATVDETIALKRTSFIVLIVCLLIATIISGYALAKKRSGLYYIVFIGELLLTIALVAFFIYSRTLFWM